MGIAGRTVSWGRTLVTLCLTVSHNVTLCLTISHCVSQYHTVSHSITQCHTVSHQEFDVFNNVLIVIIKGVLICIEIRFSRLKPAPSMFAFYLLLYYPSLSAKVKNKFIIVNILPFKSKFKKVNRTSCGDGSLFIDLYQKTVDYCLLIAVQYVVINPFVGT